MTAWAHVDGEVLEEQSGLICVAEWLAQLFLKPMDADRVGAARSSEGQAVLRWMGELLDEAHAAEALCTGLTQGTAEQTAVALQRRHTALFDGVHRHQGALPYASAWDGTGHLFGAALDRMQVLMKALDVHVPADCPEPADHLSIQLACMAEALRQKDTIAVTALLEEMEPWVRHFSATLVKADEGGFHAAIARFLMALLQRIRKHHSCDVRRDTAASVELA